jgi:arabinoxylan arabinofuranohydrolase
MKKQGFNPYLPSWEYIPDGEPYVFGNRVYIYGSHDKFNGHDYCLDDYVCWSAPEDDLSDWRYEGVIYPKTSDPLNKDGRMSLFAPDVTKGPDERYYLFYVLNAADVVSVAVCDSPACEYKFLGYVHYPDGTMLGRRKGDQPQFDPGVLTEGDKTYILTGICGHDTKTRPGSTAVTLGPDMLTVLDEPVLIAPGVHNSKNTSFEGHEFFEASSLRKRGDTYYFVYSSIAGNQLCYATSKSPLKDYVYGGVIISNADINIGTYKPAEKPMYCGGNNHGSIVEIKGRWHIFYHKHTNGHEFSRQGCLEPVEIKADGSIPQVEMTSCGPNGGPLEGKGEFPAYIACNIFSTEDGNQRAYRRWPNHNEYLPKITQDGRDGDKETGFVTNILDNYGIGFKYFDCKGVKRIKIKTRGYSDGVFHVKTKWDGESLASVKIDSSNTWAEYSSDINLPDGTHALYFIYKGTRFTSMTSFTLE